MTRPLTPAIRVRNALEEKRLAEQRCVHWDNESDGDNGHDCCEALRDAEEELRKARRAYIKESQ